MIGFARVCKECLREYSALSDYDTFKRFILKRATLEPKRTTVELKLMEERGAAQQIKESGDVYIHIGIDDADSPYGMCTTYLGALIYGEVISIGEPMDYPLLVRLNPNIPMKTRGNASIGMRFKIPAEQLCNVEWRVLQIINQYAHTFFPKTNTSLVLYVTNDFALSAELIEIYQKAVKDVVPLIKIHDKLSKLNYGFLKIYSIREGSRGIVGALAGVGALFYDYTYELLVYRLPENVGRERIIDAKSVIRMNQKMGLYTFDNVDRGRILISPKGADPILFGIRGDFPEKLLEAFKLVRHEPISLWCIFRSNQATSSHVINIKKASEARPYWTVKLQVTVERIETSESKVRITAYNNDWRIEAYIYKLQTALRNIARKLVEGDEIEIIGAVMERRPKYLEINVEEIIPLNLTPLITVRNPICPECGARLKKKSKDRYICEKCGYRVSFSHKLIILEGRTNISEKRRYVSTPKAHRHLTMPTKRILFRSWKIAGLIKPYLIYPSIGVEKPDGHKIKKIKEIVPPKIV